MMLRLLLMFVLLGFSFQPLQVHAQVAPQVPGLNWPAEQEEPVAVEEEIIAQEQEPAPLPAVPAQTDAASQVNTEVIAVESVTPPSVTPSAENAAPEPSAVQTGAEAPAVQAQDAHAELAPQNASSEAKTQPQETPAAAAAAEETQLVQYNPPTDRDPTLSPDDTLLLAHREAERLRALEAERQRKLEEERRRLAELERKRQLELERLRDPSREVRGKIRVSGIIGQEVFIGNKIYSVGQTILGARIVEVRSDSVVFTYKGQRFIKHVDLR